jgi:nucleotide-binding universal stress UspA family protein
MLTTVLAPLDGSPLAERVLPFALGLARATGARLLLLRAAQARPRPGGDPRADALDALGEAETYLDGVARRLDAPDLTVDTAAPYGDAAQAVVDEAARRRVDLIAMSTHGRSGVGRWLFGSVADHVLRHAAAPVLLVPTAAVCRWPADAARRILVPLDGSALAPAALGPAADLARLLDGELLLTQVVVPPQYAMQVAAEPYVLPDVDEEAELAAARRDLEAAAEPLRRAGLAVATQALVGWPATEIAATARAGGAALIAMATHGRGGLARLALGSVAVGTLQQAGVPVLLVRPAALGPAEAPGGAAALALTGAERDLLARGLVALLDGETPDPAIRALLARLREAGAGGGSTG